MLENFPFMLSASKHSEPFFSNLLESCASGLSECVQAVTFGRAEETPGFERKRCRLASD